MKRLMTVRKWAIGNLLDYSRTPLIRSPIGPPNLAALTGGRINDGLFTRKCKAVFARQPKKVVVITR